MRGLPVQPAGQSGLHCPLSPLVLCRSSPTRVATGERPAALITLLHRTQDSTNAPHKTRQSPSSCRPHSRRASVARWQVLTAKMGVIAASCVLPSHSARSSTISAGLTCSGQSPLGTSSSAASPFLFCVLSSPTRTSPCPAFHSWQHARAPPSPGSLLPASPRLLCTGSLADAGSPHEAVHPGPPSRVQGETGPLQFCRSAQMKQSDCRHSSCTSQSPHLAYLLRSAHPPPPLRFSH